MTEKVEKCTNEQEPYALPLHPKQNHTTTNKQEPSEKGEGRRKTAIIRVQDGPNKAVGWQAKPPPPSPPTKGHTTAATDTAQNFAGEEKYRVERQPQMSKYVVEAV